MPSPDVVISRSSQYGAAITPNPVAGRQTLERLELLVVNWMFPFELALKVG